MMGKIYTFKKKESSKKQENSKKNMFQIFFLHLFHLYKKKIFF